MKKPRNKKYNPHNHKVDATIAFRIVQNVKPLSEHEKLDLWKQATTAINAMQYGRDVSKQDFTTLCDMVNISLLLTEKDIGKEYLQDLYAAREGMQRAKERFFKTNRLGFDSQGLIEIKQALVIHGAQLEVCTFGEFAGAYDEQNKRIAAGEFYKPGVDTRDYEKVAA